MNIKIECACGTRFSFDVEPVNGRMPVDVACPGCQTSAVEVANAEIKRRLAEAAALAPAAQSVPAVSTTPAPSSIPSIPARPIVAPPQPAAQPPSSSGAMRVSIPGHGAASAPAAPRAQPPAPVPSRPAIAPGTMPSMAPSSLRINKPAAPVQAAAPVAAQEPAEGARPGQPAKRFCNKHQTRPAADSCRMCGKAICLTCMEQFGYLCSVYCREQAEATGKKIPRYKLQRRGIDDKRVIKAQRTAMAVAAFIVLFLGVWFWYAWFARNPKVVYSVPEIAQDPNSDKPWRPAEYFQLIGPGQLLSVKSKRLNLYDVVQDKLMWSAQLESDAEAAAVKAAKEKNDEIMKLTPKDGTTPTPAWKQPNSTGWTHWARGTTLTSRTQTSR